MLFHSTFIHSPTIQHVKVFTYHVPLFIYAAKRKPQHIYALAFGDDTKMTTLREEVALGQIHLPLKNVNIHFVRHYVCVFRVHYLLQLPYLCAYDKL